MRALLLLCFVFFANGQIADLGKGMIVHLGPFDTAYTRGNITVRYLPLTGKDYVASRTARALVEKLRRFFKVGFNVCPPLDPYTKKTLPVLSLDNYLPLVKGEVDFKNLVITGAQRFQQNLLELRLDNGRVDFELTIPTLFLDVDVKTNLVLADTVPFQFAGHLSLELSRVNVTGVLQALPTTPNTLGERFFHLVALDYHLHIDDVAVQLKGSNEKLNKLIEESLLIGIDVVHDIVPPSLLAKLVYYLNRNAAKVVLDEANNMLTIANTKQVLAYLVPNNVC